MAIIVFQHSDIGRPGRLGLTLRDHGFKMDIRRLDRGEAIPPDFDDVEGVISLGGPQTCATGHDRPDWMGGEIDYLRRAHERELPVIGVCLGHQLIAVALGGEVTRMSKPELGFHPVTLTGAGQVDTVLAGVPWTSRQYCHHEDNVSKPPAAATVLSGSQMCPMQSFRAGIRTYAFQYHFEVDHELIHRYTRTSLDELAAAGVSEAELGRQVDEHYASFARLADRLCVNMAMYLLVTGDRFATKS